MIPPLQFLDDKSMVTQKNNSCLVQSRRLPLYAFTSGLVGLVVHDLFFSGNSWTTFANLFVMV